MTGAQYLDYARLFDAVVAVNAFDPQSISLMGDLAGDAVKEWAAARSLEVASDRIQGVLDRERGRVEWTVLRVSRDFRELLTVHLHDEQPVAVAEVA